MCVCVRQRETQTEKEGEGREGGAGAYPGGVLRVLKHPPRARVCLMNIVCTYHNSVY